MIPFMYDHGWDQPHVQMHVIFWATIENHDWRNSHNKHQQRALLVYQGQQRHNWHNCIASPKAFDLSIINEDVLCNTLDILLIQARTEQLDVISSVSSRKPFSIQLVLINIFRFICSFFIHLCPAGVANPWRPMATSIRYDIYPWHPVTLIVVLT
jgi:hypothetical protein